MCVHDIEMSSVIYSWCSLGIIIAGNFQSVKFSWFSQLAMDPFMVFTVGHGSILCAGIAWIACTRLCQFFVFYIYLFSFIYIFNPCTWLV